MTEYVTTKEECEANIDGVCPGCGGPITAIETVDNFNQPTYWQGCEHCFVFTEGYPLEIHKVARLLVQSDTLVPYRYVDKGVTEQQQAVWLDVQTRGAAYIIRRAVRLLEQEREAKT